MNLRITLALFLFATHESFVSGHYQPTGKHKALDRTLKTLSQLNKLQLPKENELNTNKAPRKLFLPEPWDNVPMGLIQGALTGTIAGKWAASKKPFVVGEKRRHFKNASAYEYENDLVFSKLNTAQENVDNLSPSLSQLAEIVTSLGTSKPSQPV